MPPRKQRPKSGSASLHRRIVDALNAQRRPIPLARLAALLDLHESDEALLHAVARLRSEGVIYAQNGDRYASAEGRAARIGRISVNEAGYGFVAPEGGGDDIHVPAKKIGDAINGDRVLVAPMRTRTQRGPAGEVLGVVERPPRVIVGAIRLGPGFAWVHPDERNLPDIQLLGPVPRDTPEGYKVVARLEPITLVTTVPIARLERVLGDPTAPWIDIEGIIYEYGLRDGYPAGAEEEARRLPHAIGRDALAGRRDLRRLDVVTIDPADAADLDDALSLGHDVKRRRVVGIHIADVSHYVAVDGAIDQEALARGTSVYLPGRVLHMLPSALSERLCSLRPGGDRLAVSVLVTFNAKGEPVEAEITKGIVRSRAQLSYEQVQAVLDGDRTAENPATPHADMLAELWKLAQGLGEQRQKAGALDFDVPEIKVEVDADGRVAALRRRERLDSHRLIEEFMLLANRTVAQRLKAQGYELLYRVHAGPDPARLQNVAALAAAVGHPIAQSGHPVTVKELQALLEAVKGEPIAPVLGTLIIRSLPKALYQPDNIGHFGLATEEYAHFTSPIRRYPDLVVHRQVARLLAGQPSAYPRERLEWLGQVTSEAEQRAEAAEREAVRAKQVEYLARRIGEEFRGTISGVQKFGLFVALDESLAEGLIPVEELPKDEYRYDPSSLTLIGRQSRYAYHFGDPVVVQVARVDIEMRRVDFALVDAPQARRRRKSDRAAPAPASEARESERRPRGRRRPSRGHQRLSRRPRRR